MTFVDIDDGRDGPVTHDHCAHITGPFFHGAKAVVPVGGFEDDPNVTDKKFPGNPTRSYRSPHALRIVAEVTDWEGHPPEVLQGMLDNLARLRAQGLDVIED